jgi:glycerophosphoryl diester phosphodiesterase
MIRTLKTDIVSHRGGTFLWPENSLEAFGQSLDLPVEQVECDVHLTADGVPVVIHDAVLNRLTDAKGPVSDRTLAELRQIRLRGGRGGHVPSLAEVAALFTGRQMRLQVELKADAQGRAYPDLLDRTIAVLDEAGIRGQCLIITFDAVLAASALAAGGFHRVIWLFEAGLLNQIGVEGVVAVARSYGFEMIETEIGALDDALVTRFQQEGLRIGAWGANHEETLRKAFALGLDAVATDDPILAVRLRG